MIDHHKSQINQLIQERTKTQEDQRKRYEEDLAYELKRTTTNLEEETKRIKDKLKQEIDSQGLEIKDLSEKLRESQNAREVSEKSLQVERD